MKSAAMKPAQKKMNAVICFLFSPRGDWSLDVGFCSTWQNVTIDVGATYFLSLLASVDVESDDCLTVGFYDGNCHGGVRESPRGD